MHFQSFHFFPPKTAGYGVFWGGVFRIYIYIVRTVLFFFFFWARIYVKLSLHQLDFICF